MPATRKGPGNKSLQRDCTVGDATPWSYTEIAKAKYIYIWDVILTHSKDQSDKWDQKLHQCDNLIEL